MAGEGGRAESGKGMVIRRGAGRGAEGSWDSGWGARSAGAWGMAGW